MPRLKWADLAGPLQHLYKQVFHICTCFGVKLDLIDKLHRHNVKDTKYVVINLP